MKERIEYIDATKAICMLLVVLGHCFWAEQIPHLNGAIYSFHMPIFFVIAGFFIKAMTAKDALKKYSKAYLLPYLITGLICLLVTVVLSLVGECELGASIKESMLRVAWGSGWGEGDTLFSSIPIVGYMWFLLALFWACLFYSIIDKKVPSEFRKALLIILLAVISRISVNYIRLPFSIQSGVFSLLFVYSGALIKRYEIIEKLTALPAVFYVLITLVCAFHLLKCQTILQTGKVSLDSFGILTTLLVCCMVLVLVKGIGIKGGWLGKNTLLFLCGHAIFNFASFYSDKFSFNTLPFNTYVNLIIEFSVNVVAAYIIARLLSLLPVFRKE